MTDTIQSLPELMQELRQHEARYTYILSNRLPATDLIKVRSRIVRLRRQIAQLPGTETLPGIHIPTTN
ncbi:MAG: hypothetical protein EOO16_07310 [Chitinophagaceae bacterium]|nr:MAG: hypothetical protein EOO16_07310 [Chitinophagaceae bacterium]